MLSDEAKRRLNHLRPGLFDDEGTSKMINTCFEVYVIQGVPHAVRPENPEQSLLL